MKERSFFQKAFGVEKLHKKAVENSNGAIAGLLID